MNRVLKSVYRDFMETCKPSEATHWQSTPINQRNKMYESENLFFTLGHMEDPVKDLRPDLEWCHIHFMERVSGKPLNPGESYKHWPYYFGNEINNDKVFRKDGIFSHTYMERFWPKYKPKGKKRKGIRFEYGDLFDVISLLNEQPNTRQAFLSIWHPEDQANLGVRVPCTIGYWFRKSEGRLNVTYLIRSCDLVRHLRNDLYLTYLLLDYVCKETGSDLGSITTWVGNLHCFESDFYFIKTKILKA